MIKETSLTVISRAAEMLEKANTIQEIKEFKDLALTAADWAKRKGLGKEAVRHAQLYALMAERKLGMMLKETERIPGPGRGKKKYPERTSFLPPMLSDLGLTKRESSEAQILAHLSEDDFREVKEGRKSKKAAINEARRNKRRSEAKKSPKLPGEKKYRIIYADPPWQYDQWLPHQYGDVEKYYPTMTIEELCALPINTLAEKDSVLFLWVPSPQLERAFEVIRAWEYGYRTSFVWDKIKHNFGYYNSIRHEFLLVGGRGSSTPDSKKLYDSVISIERSKIHSEKPAFFREMIDSLYTWGNRIELFARGDIPENWDRWGNE